ncbi:putative glycoside hydrolase family 32 protein [Phaeomoniella chlamydospora]|uniref:Putative glycoside hydrolase family 32 protein n=1 Tax=Phaeomoniella chlamydospora TaxID=158046 RepID=A0A0G2E7W1_PHACM|nr:putative glycoside hydrolase family 32 protein [Phaeomoniella chlamydospora]
MYVMMISINPGSPLGGSITQYFPGDFNGTHFTAVDGATRFTDFAKDNYAGQFFYGIPATEPQVSVAWASNWQYTNLVPTGDLEGWRSAMSLPRIQYLTNATRSGYDLVSAPYDLTPILSTPLASNQSLGNGTLLVDFASDILPSNAIYFSVNVTSIPTSAPSGDINMTLFSSISGESISLGQLPLGSDLFLNRGKTYGFDNVFFTDKFFVTNLIDSSQGSTVDFRLEGVYDRSLLEIFCNGGIRAGTISVFPEQLLDTIVIKTGNLNTGVKVDVSVWGLKSAWMEYENGRGLVSGNVTNGMALGT